MDPSASETQDNGCFIRIQTTWHRVRNAESSLAWLILLVHILSAVVPAAYVLPGIYLPTFVRIYDCTLEEASWAVSVGYSSLCAAGILMHPIEKHFGRIIPAAVAILTTAGATAFIPFYKNIWINVVCFGCLSGFGQGIMVHLTYRMLRDYFTSMYGMAFGSSVAMAGVWASAYPYVIYQTETSLGLVASCLIVGGIILTGMLGVGVMVFVKYLEGQENDSADRGSTLSVKYASEDGHTDIQEEAGGTLDSASGHSELTSTPKDSDSQPTQIELEENNSYRYGTWQLYRRFLSMGMFWVISVTFLITVVVLTIIHGLLFDMMLFRGISKRTASLYFTIMNVGGTVGKLYMGYLTTLNFSARFITGFCLTALLLVSVGLGVARDAIFIGSLTGAAGLFSGIMSSTAVLLYQESVPLAFRNDFASFGYSVMGTLSIFATPVAALLEAHFGYSASMYFTGACCVLGLIPLMGLKAMELYQRIVLRVDNPSTVANVF